MIEVLHCAETIKGGVATYLKELIPLQRFHFGANNIAIIIPDSQRDELTPVEGVIILSYPDRKNRLLNSLAIAKATRAFLLKNPAKIVHIHSTFAGASIRPLLRLSFRDLKVIYCPHGWAWDRPTSIWKRQCTIWVERLLSTCCDRIVCISQHEKNTALRAGIKKSKLVVILNGIRESTENSVVEPPCWPKGNLKLLFVGRFDHQKGVDVFCSALTLLGKNACGILVGDYVLGDTKRLEIPQNVNHVGWLKSNQLQNLYATADILIIPSRWEGFGLVATEAMRAGLPVIASKVGGLPEIVEHLNTGLLVSPCHTKELVEAINSLDAETLISMGKSGRERFEQMFTIVRVHEELLNTYKALNASH
ncbi:glycosyltransferase-like protein [Pseudomonas psychrophila]|nr:glycosyltransferase-like protein [Pseudomonas psychrophila]